MAKFTGNVSSDGLGNPGLATEQGAMFRTRKSKKQKRNPKQIDYVGKFKRKDDETIFGTKIKKSSDNSGKKESPLGDKEPNLVEKIAIEHGWTGSSQRVNPNSSDEPMNWVDAEIIHDSPTTPMAQPKAVEASPTIAENAPESRVAAMKTGVSEPKERTPTYKEVRAGVTEWRKTKGESGVSPEEGVNLGNETYNRKAAAKAGYAEEKASSIGSSPQFGDTNSVGSADAQKKA